MKYNKGTFIIIPNKERLKGKPSELQTIYMWLCNYADEKGMCFPSRTRLAKESGCGLKTVDKYLQQLVEEGFILKKCRSVEGKKQKLSNMYTLLLMESVDKINLEYPERGIAEVDKQIKPYVEKGATVVSKQEIESSSKNGAVTQPNINSTQLTQVLTTGQLPLNRGKTYIQRVLSVYTDLFKYQYNFVPTINMGRWGKNLKELMTTHTELQISALLITFFNWRGMTGNDEFERDKLLKATFNTSWFFSQVSQYEVYLRNVFGLDLNDDDKVREFVANQLLAINKK